MRAKVYLAAVLALYGLPCRAADKHTLPPALPAVQYPAHETHADEQVTIAADPLDTKDKANVFRVDYAKRALLPVRMIVTNDSDKPIHLDQARIYFITRDGEKLHAETEEQVDRRMSDIKDPSRTAQLPFPIRKMSGGLKNKDTDIHKDFDESDFRNLVVAPHTTESGVLFFDISDYSRPLQDAKLYVKQITEEDGNELFYFEVPLAKYLAATPKEHVDPKAADPAAKQ